MSAHGMKYTTKAVCNGCGACRPAASFTVPSCAGDVAAALCLDCLKAGVRMCSNPKAAPLAATALLLLVVAALPALDLRIDRPDDWADPDASHHGKHALTGAAIAVPSYLGARAVGLDRGPSFAAAVAVPFVAGIVYEIQRAPSGAYCDPVDMAWTATGGLLAASACYATDRFLVAPLITSDAAGVALCWEF